MQYTLARAVLAVFALLGPAFSAPISPGPTLFILQKRSSFPTDVGCDESQQRAVTAAIEDAGDLAKLASGYFGSEAGSESYIAGTFLAGYSGLESAEVRSLATDVLDPVARAFDMQQGQELTAITMDDFKKVKDSTAPVVFVCPTAGMRELWGSIIYPSNSFAEAKFPKELNFNVVRLSTGFFGAAENAVGISEDAYRKGFRNAIRGYNPDAYPYGLDYAVFSGGVMILEAALRTQNILGDHILPSSYKEVGPHGTQSKSEAKTIYECLDVKPISEKRKHPKCVALAAMGARLFPKQLRSNLQSLWTELFGRRSRM